MHVWPCNFLLMYPSNKVRTNNSGCFSCLRYLASLTSGLGAKRRMEQWERKKMKRWGKREMEESLCPLGLSLPIFFQVASRGKIMESKKDDHVRDIQALIPKQREAKLL